MAVTRSDLIERFPEFQSAPDDLIDAHLADAALQIDESVLGDNSDTAVLYLACHTIALSQYGERLALKSDSGDTAYNRLLRMLIHASGASWRMI